MRQPVRAAVSLLSQPGEEARRSGSDAYTTTPCGSSRDQNAPWPNKTLLNILIRHFVPLFSHTNIPGQENANWQHRGGGIQKCEFRFKHPISITFS